MHGRNYRIPSGMPTVRKEYLPGAPNPKIAKFSLGNAKGDYDYKLQLIAKARCQIRHNALEAARVAANKKLAKIGEDRYFLQVKVYPHVILRENKMIATAGADRLQEGMRKAYGKPVGLAARVDDGTVLLEVNVYANDVEAAKEALKGTASKLPVKTSIEVLPLKEAEQQAKT
ncbi:MAG: 50S ribosomal protein L16 [Thaumarchaeota archaeon]|nr:50S ribosomal protein L16 [Nitrososphaerota archaeon]